MSKRAKIFPLVLITAIVVAMLSVASVASTLGTCSTSLSPERCSCVANSHPCHGEANTRTMVSLTGKLVSYTIPNQTQKLVTGERWKTGDEGYCSFVWLPDIIICILLTRIIPVVRNVCPAVQTNTDQTFITITGRWQCINVTPLIYHRRICHVSSAKKNYAASQGNHGYSFCFLGLSLVFFSILVYYAVSTHLLQMSNTILGQIKWLYFTPMITLRQMLPLVDSGMPS